ncbi:PH domain-containing protein [candidate division WWE3 bacterium]|uniref:PH domain-containing protein n=1 Tax=candidate division WWE3 bacterium TaxID=2053526 RepID=A0A955LKE3_UNCKA|nr:PH domain-containing protein [candidate division WWE3 bacterium]
MFNPLATFVYDHTNIPSITFGSQKINEPVLLFVRRDVATNIGWVVVLTLLALLPTIVKIHGGAISIFLGGDPLAALFNAAELGLITLLYYMLILYVAFLNFLKWYFNVLIVTDQRIIDINFTPPFSWRTAQAQLEEVQDVQHTQAGILGIIFNYGDVMVQTAGTKQNIAISKVPNPNRIHELIIQNLP